MDEAAWILVFNIFASIILLIRPSEFPAFFDDEDLKSMGVKGHKSHFVPPPVTGRYTEHAPGYIPAVKNDQNEANIPPNGLPVPYKPPQMFQNRPFKPVGRGDPSDQNIVQQMEDDEAESIFPDPDGKPYGGEDFTHLDQLPKRLTETGKWAEFKALLTEEGEQFKDGKIMENWEDDAHMWASYSKHLLERAEHDKQKKISRQSRPEPPRGMPSFGHQQYWRDDEESQSPAPSPVGPWGQPPDEGEGFDFNKFGAQDPSIAKPKGRGRRPGGPPDPGRGWGQGYGPSMGQTPGEGWNTGGAPPPGWGQGGNQGSGSGWFMGGAPPPGWGGGGGQSPGGGMNMGGPPPGWGQGGASQPVPNWDKSGGQGPGGAWGQGGPPSPGGNWGQSGLPGPGPGWGPGGPSPGGSWGQGGAPGPGGGWGPRGPGRRMQAGSQGPVGKRTKWIRRQMEEDMKDYDNKDDNLKGPLNHHPLPPLYYQGNNPDMPDFQPGLPEDRIPTGQDDSYLLPEQRQEQMPEMDYPNGLTSSDVHRLQPRPNTRGSLALDKPEGDMRPVFDEGTSPDQIPGYTGGKMPGPGSERDFPNGYRPSYGNSPLEMFQNTMNQDPSGGQRPVQGPFGGKYPQVMPASLRQGGSFPGMNDYSESGGPGDYPEEIQNALRMGSPGGFQGQPGPGSEKDFPDGFHPSIAAGNIERGPPPGFANMNGGRPPGMQRGRPPSMQQGPPPGSSYPHSGMPYGGAPGWQGGAPPGMQGPPGTSGFSPPGEPAFQPPGMDGHDFPPGMSTGPMPGRGGPPPPEQSYPEYPDGPSPGGGNQNLRTAFESSGSDQQGFQPRNKYLPSGYQLMKIAQQKISAQDRIAKLTERPKPATTTEHVPTKEEMISRLPQFDDFHAPIRWVPLNSQDTRDGLARLTDRKTHKNQQYVIEGEMYVPIVDEDMSRLDWTTESLNATMIEVPFKPPVDDSAIKVVMRSMNLNTSDEQEWLAFETILGPKRLYGNECDGESCQSRCYKTGCDSVCKGDTCASGCVGVSCNAVCRAPGCFSMCIGEQCSAKCEGLNCETRCWGKHCDATCKMFSCSFTVNGGRSLRSNATWEQMYPQYDHRYSNPDIPQHKEVAPPPDNNDYYE